VLYQTRLDLKKKTKKKKENGNKKKNKSSQTGSYVIIFLMWIVLSTRVLIIDNEEKKKRKRRNQLNTFVHLNQPFSWRYRKEQVVTNRELFFFEEIRLSSFSSLSVCVCVLQLMVVCLA